MNRAAKGAPRPAPVAEARRVEASAPPADDFTYARQPADAPPRGGTERRAGARQPTRLRSGKIVRLDGRFLCECLVRNRSTAGCRLRVPEPASTLPPTLFFYDDQTELLFQGRVIWRKERELGLRLTACRPSPLYRSIVGAMRRKFYALPR